MSEREEKVASAVGVAGHLARAVTFALIGFFLVRAAYQYDPEETVGLDGALAKIARADYGPWLLGLTAAGPVCLRPVLLRRGALARGRARRRVGRRRHGRARPAAARA